MPVLQAFNLGLCEEWRGWECFQMFSSRANPLLSHQLTLPALGFAVWTDYQSSFASLDWRKRHCPWVCLHLVEEPFWE